MALDALPVSQRPHLVAIQETHWREDSATEFTSGPWRVISSQRNGYKAAGVLILIHHALLPDAVLAYSQPHPGLLSQRPARHTLLLLGDFNTPLSQHVHIIKYGAYSSLSTSVRLFAFDTLEWCHIADALQDAAVPDDLQAHIMEWHHDIQYHLEIQGQHVEISASRGITQGCLVAPSVWALGTGRFLYLLALYTDPLWVAQDVTAYADDFHAGSKVLSLQGLERLITQLGSLLDVLARAGLHINALKSAILNRFMGHFARHWIKLHTRRCKDGDLFRLRTPSGTLYEFPIVDTHTYLGTRVSYHDPRVQTLKYRMQLAQLEWSRLRPEVL